MSGARGALVLLVSAIVAGTAPTRTRVQAQAPHGHPSAATSTELQLTDGQGAYRTRTYRNLFAEAGHTQKEIDAKIARAYEQLFRGDREAERLYVPGGTNENGALAYIPDVQHNDVRSEGMSYGMMVAVQLDKKAEFDALWKHVSGRFQIILPQH